MKKVTKKLRVQRIISFVLACVMVLTMLSPVSVEAAENSLSTDKDVYEVGEPIMVTASSDSAGDWVGLYTKGSEASTDYWYWYYVNQSGYTNGETYNIYDTEYYTTYSGSFLPAGKYVLRLENANISKEIEIVEPAENDAAALKVESTNIKYGDPLNVILNYYGQGSWVGLYKKGETYDPNAGGKLSIFWYYVNGHMTTTNILNAGDANGRASEFKAGEYSLVLFQDGGYTPYQIIDITVTTEIDETKTVEVKPTCEKDGSITYTYTDGTTKTVGPEENEELKATGHAYPEKWTYVGKEAKKHSKVCGNDASHIETGECEFDEGVVKTPATEDAKGVKTYTCKICDGTYDEEYSLASVTKTEVIKEATCEEKGTLRTHYSDGTYIDSEIKEKGHNYSEWDYNEETREHSKVCANDETHVVTEECEFDAGVIEGDNVKYTCSVCEGYYTEASFFTDKTEYKYGEPIKVTAKGYSGKDWVGLYKKGETYNPNAGGSFSIYWYYVSEQSQEEVNILQTRDENGRSGEYKAGEYTVVLFGDDSYTPIKTIDITVTAEIDESKTVRTEPTCTEDGSITYTYTDGTKETVGPEADKSLEATGHAYPETWTYVGKEAKKHSKVCENDESHVLTEDCVFDKGEVTTEPANGKPGIKTFTCETCSGTYTVEFFNKEVVKEEITKAPTCESEGVKTITYDDGSTSTEPVKALGHAYPETWTYDASAKTHTKICENDETHVQTGECNFSKSMNDGKFVYTCNVCEGTYEESVIRTDKKKYDFEEAINVTVDYEFGALDWVGLYKKGETPGGPVSFYYYYPNVSGKTFNVYSSPYVQLGGDRGQIESGEYTLYLCANDGYTVIASIDVTIGHEFGEWKYDADTKTHSRTCDGSMKHQEGPVACTFESEVTKEPTATEIGIKTFTCSECGGSYEEVLPATSATIVKTETIDPTCETDGKIIFTYSDGTVTEEVIKKLGHDYDEENCVFNEADKTHTVVCKNDSSHVKITNCNFNRIILDGDKATYKCTVCGGTFEDGLLVVPKDTYSASEDINVIASCDSNDSWVGLYGVDDEIGRDVSYYWYYVVSAGINRDGKTVNLTDKAFYNTERLDSMTPGEYKIVLFGDGGYDKIIAEKTITITEASTTYDIEINGKEVSDGEVLQFKNDDAVNVKVTANGNPGTSWVGIYTAHLTKDTDFASIVSADYFWIAENNGKTVNIKSAFCEPGDYCIVIFGDHGHDFVKQIIYYTFTKDGAERILIEPTCTKPGIKYVVYDDGTDAYVPIAKLGHDVKEWTYDAETKTHSGVCERVEGDATCGQTVTEECKFEAVEDEAGVMINKCTVCDGQYSEAQEEVIPPYEEKEDRIYGDTRYETATKIADQLKKDQNIEKFNSIIIASGTGYADALSGTYLAKVKNAPILLVNSKDAKTIKSIADYVNANLADGGTVYILGGKQAISDAFNANLTVDKNQIKRLGGATRYETNILILKEAGVTGGEVMVCTGNNFADSLSASALGRPVLLIDNKALTKEQKTFVKGLESVKFYIIGGKNAISYDMEDVIRDFGGTERISGETRYETSVKLAERFVESPKSMILAYGEDFPDGLVGGIFALNMDAPLLLVSDRNKECAVDYAKNNDISSGKVLGGEIRISESVAKEIFAVSEE